MHYITDDFQLIKKGGICNPFPGQHTAAHLVSNVIEVIDNYNINYSNVVQVVMDNEATNNLAGDLLHENFGIGWYGCADHLIELVTKHASEHERLAPTIADSKKLISSVRNSLQANSKLIELQTVMHVEGHDNPVELVEDVATRWWTTYSMLERLYDLRKVISNVGDAFPKVNEKYLTEGQWVLIKGIVQLLKPFMTVQKLLEGDSYVTMSVLPIMIDRLRKIINEAVIGKVQNKTNNTYSLVDTLIVDDIKEVGTCMLRKFEERWGDGEEGHIFPSRGHRNIRVGFPLISLAAAAMDPRTKNLHTLPPLDKAKVWEYVREISVRYCKDYYMNLQHIEDHHIPPEMNSNEIYWDDSEYAPQTTFATSSFDFELDKEIELYKREPVLRHSNDHPECPLQWWRYKSKQGTYTILSKLARVVLCVPATSASSERIFSIAGNVVTNKRTRLDPDIVSDILVVRGEIQKNSI